MSRAVPVLDAQQLSKSLSTRTLLDQVNFTIARGEKVGLVGDNGAGKSTLAKILAGREEPDLGTLHVRKGAKIDYLEQEPTFAPGLTAQNAALLGLEEWLAAQATYQRCCDRLTSPDIDDTAAILEAQAEASTQVERLGGWNRGDEAKRILKMLRIEDTNQLVETMSGGERRRVALAALLISRPDLAIFDEPTNHLDAETIEWLESHLAENFPGAIVLITHDRWLLNQVVDRTVEIEHGSLYSYKGGWESFLLGRDERREREKRTEANRQNFLRKEIEWLRRQPKARTGKQKARIDRAEAALAVDAPAQTKNLEFRLGENRLGSTILEASDLSVEIVGRRLLSGLSFQLDKGSRVGIVGPSGAGKTTLLRTLLGDLPPGSGTVTRGKNTSFAYLDQMRSDLDPDATVMDAITAGRPSVTVGDQEMSSYSYLERFRFKGEAVRQKVAGLSGGERARVALARLLLAPANVLVLDEPTNDLDVMTLGALEELILGLEGAALIVSHDRYFLDRVATSVVALSGDGDAVHLQGGYEAYAEWRKQRARIDRSETVRKEPGPVASRKKKLTYAEEMELQKLMPEIGEAERAVAALEAQLADPHLYQSDREKAVRLDEELRAARDHLERKETRWLELEEKREEANG